MALYLPFCMHLVCRTPRYTSQQMLCRKIKLYPKQTCKLLRLERDDPVIHGNLSRLLSLGGTQRCLCYLVEPILLGELLEYYLLDLFDLYCSFHKQFLRFFVQILQLA